MGEFFTAWAAGYNGQPLKMKLGYKRSMMSSALTASTAPEGGCSQKGSTPAAWLALTAQDSATKAAVATKPVQEKPATPYPHAVVSWHRTSDQLNAARFRCKEATAASGQDLKISENDAIVAETIQACNFIGDMVSLMMFMEYRAFIEAEEPFLLGSAFTNLLLEVSNSDLAAGDIRKLLPEARSKDFVAWKTQQRIPPKPQISLNSWVRAFDLTKLRFEEPAAEITMGMTMWEKRAVNLSKRSPDGTAFYGFALPRSCGGVKMTMVLPKFTAEHMMSNGLVDQVTDLPICVN
jgi:hypothetical protein